MSASLQSQILDAVVATLGGEQQNVFRCQMEKFGPDDLPADNVMPEDEKPEYNDNVSIDLLHRFTVRHVVAAANAVDVAVDARYVRAQQLLLADSTLGGLVTYLRYLGRIWDFESGGQEYVTLVVTYGVEFSTSRLDPSLAGY